LDSIIRRRAIIRLGTGFRLHTGNGRRQAGQANLAIRIGITIVIGARLRTLLPFGPFGARRGSLAARARLLCRTRLGLCARLRPSEVAVAPVLAGLVLHIVAFVAVLLIIVTAFVRAAEAIL